MKSVCILALLISAAMAAGQGRNQPAFTFFDANGDGKITKTEFEEGHKKRIEQKKEEGRMLKNQADAPAFEDIDTDGDGTITQEEFIVHQAKQRAQ